MDDLDLEKLKQELDDVSGGSRYDIDDIMREAGASEPEEDKESLEQLMQRFGIRMDEPQPKAEGFAAPVTEDMMPKLPETEDLSALFRAAEQCASLSRQQFSHVLAALRTALRDAIFDANGMQTPLLPALREQSHALARALTVRQLLALYDWMGELDSRISRNPGMALLTGCLAAGSYERIQK